MYLHTYCKIPSDVRDALCELDVAMRKLGYPGLAEDEEESIVVNNEEEIEGWCEDMVARLGLDESVIEQFRVTMMEWRENN